MKNWNKERGEEILITEHAKDRFIQRWISLYKPKKNFNIYVKMINMIHGSRLMKTVRTEEGIIYGYMNNREYFVCNREFSKTY